ncbi:MAG: hypothetical protein RDU89_11115 [bacterium]|nr:hypothetical protein [bacterium]
MARVKIGTALDGALLAKVRDLATREHKNINQIIEEALEQHLATRDLPGRLQAVRRSRGRLQASPELVREILAEPYLGI